MREVTSVASFEDMIAEHGTILIDFYKQGCQPCKRLAERLETVQGDEVEIVKVDCERFPTLAGRFRVMSTPTVMVLVGGNEVERGSGYMAASKIVAKWVPNAEN